MFKYYRYHDFKNEVNNKTKILFGSDFSITHYYENQYQRCISLKKEYISFYQNYVQKIRNTKSIGVIQYGC